MARKRISWILLPVAALLIVWGIKDFYHYAVIGKEVLKYYGAEEIVCRLVNNSLAQGVIKIILGLLLIPVFHFAGRKRT